MPPPFEIKLTAFDKRIINLYKEGLTASEIAIELKTTVKAIQQRTQRIKNNCGARNIPHLIVLTQTSG